MVTAYVDRKWKRQEISEARKTEISSALCHQDLRAHRAFGEDYPEAKRFLLYRGKERLLREGVSIVPVTEFLPELK